VRKGLLKVSVLGRGPSIPQLLAGILEHVGQGARSQTSDAMKHFRRRCHHA
jgi:hypothetical protein